MANLVPLSKSSLIKKQTSSIIKTGTFSGGTGNMGSNVINKNIKTNDKSLLETYKKVIKIDNILKKILKFKTTQSKQEKSSAEKKQFEKREKELEKKNQPKEKSKINLPSGPKMGFLDWIKNFLLNTFLGFISIRLIDFLPQLMKILPTIIRAGEFLIDWGGKLLDGLVTFIDWGYKAYDGTRGFLKNLGGEGLAKNFDKFSGAIGNLIDVLIFASIASAGTGGDGGGRGDRKVGKKLTGGARRGIFQKGARSAFMGLAGKGGAKTILKFVKPLVSRIPIIGGLIEFGLSWVLGEPVGKAAFRGIGAVLVGAIGTAIGGPIGAFLGSWAGGEAGGLLYDMFFGNKKPKQKKVAKAAGGGKPSTRGGKLVGGPAKRTIKRKKAPRTLTTPPTKLKPGSVVGGEKKIKELYPESKDKTKMSPFDFIKNTYERLSRSKGLERVASLGLKPIMGDRLNYADFKGAATVINNWMNQTMTPETLAYAGGGEVRMEQVISGEDYSNVIAKSLQESVAPESEKIIQDLMKQLMLKKTEQEIKEKEPTGEPTTPEGIPLGEGETASGRALMSGLVQRGFTKEEAAAIVGNLWAESGFRTTATNPTSGAFGLMQWLGGRKSRLYSYAAEQGKQVTDVNLQLDYIKWELKGGNAYETAQFQKAMAYGSGVADKTRGFAQEVERASARELSSSMSKRVGAAESVYGGRMVAGERPSNNYSATSGKFKVIEYITGDRNHPNLDVSGHGLPSNYHDHIAFATVSEKEKAKSALRAAGIQIGSENDGRHAVGSYHYKNLAIDIPGAQWKGSGAIGSKEFAGSRKVRQVLGIGQNAPRFHGGPILKTGMLLGHKGEYVIDRDSVELFGDDFMKSINEVENKSQLIARAPSIIEKLKAISNYTEDDMPTQIVFVEVPVPEIVPISSGSKSIIAAGGGSGDIDNMGDIFNAVG